MFSVFNPSKCTHTWSSGQPTLRRPGSSWGFGALLKGLTSVVDNSCWSRDSNPQHWVTSLTLYLLEPLWLKSWMKIVESKDVLRIKRFLLKNCLQPKTILIASHLKCSASRHVKTAMRFCLQISA